ncbi:zinc ABC transporter substrate-binding protein [Tessaracoccus sp. MC1756]|nr:zinc ABC transporter substrate-binding protein [Tessaracoccus sp. MC1756]
MVLMNVKLRASLAVAAATTLVLTACGSPSSGSTGGEGPTVIAAFYPLQWATEQVLGEAEGTVEVLTRPGGEAHGLELTPRQIASLTESDVVVYLDGFQPEVDTAIAQTGSERALNVADVIELAPIAEAHGHDEAEDEHADLDPHFWLDPERMGTVVEAIADRIAEASPEQADTYRANAASAVEELNALDEEYSTGLSECVRQEFITTHAAFNYLAERYDLEEIGISGINPDGEPSPARIAEVHEEAKRHGVTTIFFETLTSDAMARSISGDLGLKTAVLDPLEGVTEESPGDDYPSIMRANLEALRSANECN